jgi:co-chaperonin GroES (HSP10)
MKAVGNNLVVKTQPIKSKETETGLLLSVKDREDIRYNLATVISVSDAIDYIKKDDTIYYDRHAGSTLEIDDNEYKVIKIQDVVIVL